MMDIPQVGKPGQIGHETAMETFFRSSIAMVLTDPGLPDNPIVYVNEAFERATGYHRDAVVGRNCRFLQGPKTDERDIDRIRKALADRRDVTVDLINYRADGSEFTNRLLIAPIFNPENELLYYLGLQMVVDRISDQTTTAAGALQEIQHRVKNHLAMIVGLIRTEARAAGEGDGAERYGKLARRIEALQLLYEEMTVASSNDDLVDLGAYVSRIAHTISHLDGRPGLSISIDVQPARVPVDAATRVGLILSEVLTNALQHAFVDRRSGMVSVRLQRTSEGGLRLLVEDDGSGIPDGVEWPDRNSMGGRIILGLIEGLNASLDVTRAENGTIVTLDMSGETVQSEGGGPA